MPIRKYDLQIYRGSDFVKDVIFKTKNQQGAEIPYDLTGWTAKAQIRPAENSLALLTEIHCDIDNAEGVVHMEIYNNETEKLRKGKYYWDLKMDHDNSVAYYVGGRVIVEGRVTK